MVLYITPARRRELLDQLNVLGAKKLAIDQDRAATCTITHKHGGNDQVMGDHFAHDQEEQILLQQIQTITTDLCRYETCPLPSNCNEVRIGLVVDVDRTDAKRGTNESYRFHIVGDGESDPTAAPQKVAYTTPIAKLLLGLEVGEKNSGVVGGVEKTYKVKKISFPQPTTAELPLLTAIGSN